MKTVYVVLQTSLGNGSHVAAFSTLEKARAYALKLTLNVASDHDLTEKVEGLTHHSEVSGVLFDNDVYDGVEILSPDIDIHADQ